MSRKYWATISDEPVKGKYVAYVWSFTQGENLVWLTRGHKTFNIMPSKQKAEELADYWNHCFLNNGTLATH